jgi:hypothetical protein
MPLRDHFHPPLDNRHDCEGFFGGWPAMVVRSLSGRLPQDYLAGPRVRIDDYAAGGRLYDVRVFFQTHDHPVAAVEFVSPANKKGPEQRHTFVTRCAALLQAGVSIVIVDIVTTLTANLYRDFLESIGQTDSFLAAEPPSLYAVACRRTRKGGSWLLVTWTHTLVLGQPLPTLPLWVADNLAIPLDLEESYEQTCDILRIA